MLPVYIKPACLKCHGEPKGEKDIAGGIKEGYKEGEVRGAISVMIPYPFSNLDQVE
jgi:general secretion pathway protein A